MNLKKLLLGEHLKSLQLIFFNQKYFNIIKLIKNNNILNKNNRNRWIVETRGC